MMSSRTSSARIARWGLLLALGVILGRLEALLPIIPIPGVKLGLANLAMLAAIAVEGCGAALCITLARCLIGALWGGPVSMIYSLGGACLAWGATALILRVRGVSLSGASVLGAAWHHVGQLAVAWTLTGSAAVWRYLPILTLAGVFTGTLTGVLCVTTLRGMAKAGLIAPFRPDWLLLSSRG